MAMSVKQLLRPYLAYTATIRCRSHHVIAMVQPKLHFSGSKPSTRVRTLVSSPLLLNSSQWKRGGRGLSSSSTPHNVNDPGSIDSPLMQSMESKIRDELNAESVVVKDAYGDGRHVSIDVVSSAFEGQSAVNRQRMVYKAIWQELQSTVHAVDQMTTRTPTEAAADK